MASSSSRVASDLARSGDYVARLQTSETQRNFAADRGIEGVDTGPERALSGNAVDVAAETREHDASRVTNVPRVPTASDWERWEPTILARHPRVSLASLVKRMKADNLIVS